MMMDLHDYIVNQLREGKKVKIEIVGRKSKDDYLEMDWIIDKKLILKDMPFETFEGEELIELKNCVLGEKSEGRLWRIC